MICDSATSALGGCGAAERTEMSETMNRLQELQEALRQNVIEAEHLRFEIMREQMRIEYGASPSEAVMVAEYGETVTRTQAADILGVTPQTISAMQADGRLSGGVSMRSIARFMDDGKPSAKKVKHIEKYQRRARGC